MRLLPLVLATCLAAQGQIPASDARNLNPPNTDTHFTPKVYKTLGEWQAQ